MRHVRTLLLLPLLAAAGCIGGQTTVPTSGPEETVPCTLIDAGAVDAEYLGAHTLEVLWKHTAPGATPSEGVTELTVRVALRGSPSSCMPTQIVAFEISSADGIITASGTAEVISTSPSLQLDLVHAPFTTGGWFVFGQELELSLDYVDGSTIRARGTRDNKRAR